MLLASSHRCIIVMSRVVLCIVPVDVIHTNRYIKPKFFCGKERAVEKKVPDNDRRQACPLACPLNTFSSSIRRMYFYVCTILYIGTTFHCAWAKTEFGAAPPAGPRTGLAISITSPPCRRYEHHLTSQHHHHRYQVINISRNIKVLTSSHITHAYKKIWPNIFSPILTSPDFQRMHLPIIKSMSILWCSGEYFVVLVSAMCRYIYIDAWISFLAFIF